MSQQTQETKELKFERADGGAGDIQFIKPSTMEAGATVTGIYLAALPSKFDKDKSDFKLAEVDAAGNETGKTIVINGAGNLGYRMSSISVGQLIQIQYLGRRKITKGVMAGKEAHSFEVLKASEE